ncbi:Putative transcription factor SEF1 [Sugiyamaella lignohabitans]|uniref:Putative transcription factor SEF1 n=1 Tax=Sugiyamaella lignohabitans TaxID=796027 RepID=A0A167C9P2_9ASCO|nr:Putative transcription factor SEF1 [Sugiyamaella lignohabitans]ANB11403.1 Putative transcription factor SEF1 [Sugiyamaella lignohabitans]
MPSEPEFSQKWRKQQACDRCRRFKVRCQYETPEDVSCIRCTKAGAECAITAGAHGPGAGGAAGSTRKRKKAATESTALTTTTLSPAGSNSISCDECFAQKRPIISHEERLDRINLLKRRVELANEEISMLKSLDFQGDKGVLMHTQLKFRQQQTKKAEEPLSASSTTSSPVSSYTNPPSNYIDEQYLYAADTSIGTRVSWLPPVRVTCFNCVEFAIKYGFYTESELQNFFESYVTNLALYLPFPLSDRLPYNEMRKVSPVLTVTAATCMAVCSTTDRAKERIAFLERVVGEAVFIERHLSLELQMVLIMITVFVSPKIDRQAPFQLLISLAVSLSLDLGSDEDIDTLNDVNSDPEAVKIAFKRTRAYISLCTCIAGMALNSARQRLLQVMSHCERCCDAVLSRAPSYDKPIVYLLKMMLYYNTSIDKLRDPYEPFSSLLSHYETTREKLEALYTEGDAAALDWIEDRFRIPIYSSYLILLQSLNECMLSRLAMLDTSEPQFRELWYKFAEEIKRLAKLIIDGFLELSKYGSSFPNFMYFRPLHALTSLIRLRLVSWSMRLEIDIDVETPFKQAKAAWIEMKKTSYVGEQLYEFLTKVETWMNIKLGHASQQEAETTLQVGRAKMPPSAVSRGTIDTLHRIIREVITDPTTAQKKKRQESITSGSVSNSGTTASPTPAPLPQVQLPPPPQPEPQPQPMTQRTQPPSLPLAAPFPPLARFTMARPRAGPGQLTPPIIPHPASQAQSQQTQTQPPPAQPARNQIPSTLPPPQQQIKHDVPSQAAPPPAHSMSSSSSSPATTDDSSNMNPTPFNNYYMDQYDMKDPIAGANQPALDGSMLPMMYVDGTSFINQPNDIEDLLKELFNEVNSGSL